jgi:hypothetical protein
LSRVKPTRFAPILLVLAAACTPEPAEPRKIDAVDLAASEVDEVEPAPAPPEPLNKALPRLSDAAQRLGEAFLHTTTVAELHATAFDEELLQLNRVASAHDVEGIARHFAASVAFVLPTRPQAAEAFPLFEKFTLTGDPAQTVTGADAARRLVRWLASFREIDDLRFKAKVFHLVDEAAERPTATGKMGIDVRGRDGNGRRLWLSGRADFQATKGDAGWVIERLVAPSMLGRRDRATLFTEVAARTGMAGANPPEATSSRAYTGFEAVAVADVDNDGLLDAFLPDEHQDGVHLFLNNGDGTFREGAGAAGLAGSAALGRTGCLFLDIDNDGDADLFATQGSRFTLLENRLIPDGRLRFVDRGERLGDHPRAPWTCGPVAADINGDDLLDIFVPAYGMVDAIGLDTRLSNDVAGFPDLLFVSRGDGTYEEAAERWGVADTRWGLAAFFADLDDDRRPDLVVANDFNGGPGLYLNRNDHFVDEAAARGLDASGASMGLSLGDIDNDGLLDLHVTGMASSAHARIFERVPADDTPAAAELRAALRSIMWMGKGNALYRNKGAGHFRPVEYLAANWAWGGGLVDLDDDGWLDLYVPAGFFSGSAPPDT